MIYKTPIASPTPINKIFPINSSE
ncbi:hypothetical protein J4N45_04370 [Vibrio sp. SCSIO 43140]|nr:hypothetical protein J4N45_04370 [Vibrio sp. SCSIO 43140]